MKSCSKCKILQEFNAFRKDHRHSDGLQSQCRACQSAGEKRWADNNRERKRSNDKAYYAKKGDLIRNRSLATAQSNPELNRLRVARWKRENRHRVTANNRRRDAAKLRACPSWLTALQINEINEIYKKARELTLSTGIQYHVDHIIPLLGKQVRGLHVPWNLQILASPVNLSKGNRLKN